MNGIMNEFSYNYKVRTQNIFLGIGLTVLVLAILGAAGYFLSKAIKSAVEEHKDEKELEKEIEKTGSIPTMSSMTIKNLCERLYTAFKGWGTDEDAVYDAIGSVKTTADMLTLVTTYKSMYSESLPARMVDELTAGERKKVNQILRDNGVAYTF